MARLRIPGSLSVWEGGATHPDGRSVALSAVSGREKGHCSMYGTIARMKAKAGSEAQLAEQVRAFEEAHIAGAVGSYVYRMDNDPAEYYLVVIFSSKETYVANANSPEQDARYRQLLAFLEGPPEWHDGEIVYAAHPE
jgi:quinol monooxygenase YgiN